MNCDTYIASSDKHLLASKSRTRFASSRLSMLVYVFPHWLCRFLSSLRSLCSASPRSGRRGGTTTEGSPALQRTVGRTYCLYGKEVFKGSTKRSDNATYANVSPCQYTKTYTVVQESNIIHMEKKDGAPTPEGMSTHAVTTKQIQQLLTQRIGAKREAVCPQSRKKISKKGGSV